VEANQRARLRGAMVELVAEVGYPSVNVRVLARTAGVSTRTLYRRFGSVENCLAATYGELASCASGRIAAAARAEGGGEPGLRAGLRELARILAEQPKEAHLVLADAYTAGAALSGQMDAAEAGFERLLGSILAAAPEVAPLSPRLARPIVAGLAHVARGCLLDAPRHERAADRAASELADWVLELCGNSVAGPVSVRRDSAPRHSAAPGRRWDVAAALGGKVGDERARILSATLRVGAREGYAALTVPRIRSEAAVSRRSFDNCFAGVEDCFLGAVEALALAAIACAERLMARADPQVGIERAALALCTEASRNRPLARLALIGILAPGLAGLRRRQHLIDVAAARLRAVPPPGRRPTQLAQAASVAAVWQLLAAELSMRGGGDLRRLAPAVAHVLIAPMRALS
jgi:AcrR family transcriptional regulator